MTACSERQPARPQGAPPREVATETLAEGQLVDMVLEECHGPLRGRMTRVAAEIELPSGERLQAFAALPHSLRIVGSSGRFTLTPDGSYAVVVTSNEEPTTEARPATDTESARLRALLELLDRAAFGPLHRATGCRRLGPASFELVQPDAAAITLRLRERSLLPAAFSGTDGDITIDDYLRTPATWMAEQLTHPVLGSCRIVFETAGGTWNDDFFAPPSVASGATTTSTKPQLKMPVAAIGQRSPTPVAVDARAVRWLVLHDPGDWQQRARLYAPLHDRLLAEEQRIAGFPILTSIDGEAVLVIAFRARENNKRPDLPPGSRVKDQAAGRELEVYPPTGDFATRCAAGESMLREALARHELEAAGPICYQPFLHLNEGAPTSEKLVDPVVRVFVPVR